MSEFIVTLPDGKTLRKRVAPHPLGGLLFTYEDVTDRLEQESWVRTVRIHEVWDPPWTTDRISPEGRARLRSLGVSA